MKLITAILLLLVVGCATPTPQAFEENQQAVNSVTTYDPVIIGCADDGCYIRGAGLFLPVILN